MNQATSYEANHNNIKKNVFEAIQVYRIGQKDNVQDRVLNEEI